MVVFRSFIALTLIFRPMTNFEWIYLLQCEVRTKVRIFVYGRSAAPAPLA